MPSPDENSHETNASGEVPARHVEELELLTVLGRALHQVGVPAHRLEQTLAETADRLGAPAQVFSLPTGLMLSIDGSRPPMTSLVRMRPGQVDLGRLARLSKIARSLAMGALDPSEGKRQIENVMHAPALWGQPATVLAYVLSAGAFSVFFGGRWPEVVSGTLEGLAVGLLAVTMNSLGLSRTLFELTAAAAAAAIANVAYLTSDRFVEWIPLAAGLIILLPGLGLVDATDELAHGQLSAGSARMAGVWATLLAMAFGALLGLVLVEPVAKSPTDQQPAGLGASVVALALVAVAIGSTIRFRARPCDVWAALAASVTALLGSRLGAAWLGDFAGPFLAALLLGLCANGYARVFSQPSQVFSVPGLALLVPGSFGVRSMSALLSEETAVGVDTAFQMFLTATALVTGLLLSNSLFREKLTDL